MPLPAGPQIPPLLQLIQWIAQPLAFLESNAQRYGDVFTARFGALEPIVFLSHPQAIQEIFNRPEQFDSGIANDILKPLLGNHSLMLMDGERHQKQRRLVTPPFHGERMRTYGQIIYDITQQVSDRWILGEPFSVRSAMQEIAMSVIMQAVFGLREGSRCQQLKQLLAEMLDVTSSPLSSSLLFFPWLQRDLGDWSPWSRFLRRQEQIDELIYAEIQERRQEVNTARSDILSLMMAARDESGQPLTDAELRSELITLLVAGHETTASALTWALYWVHALPNVHEKLLQELNSLEDKTDFNAIFKLPYLTAVYQETLRIYPIALITFLRVLKSPMQLMGQSFEAGTVLGPCIYLTHQRPDLYPEPKQFRPERFLERQFAPHEYLPFGGGSRRCIGMAFAQYEMKLVLAAVLSRFDLAMVKNQKVQPVRRGLTLAPSAGKWLVPTGLRQADKVPARV
ncbi:cytochrome P450 [Leptolyngbya sp. FACHB-261]|uniref:cytochrome P450 n=1 Tax=Leptolyngbya sp. FACHB-261 TaxID=2692806 RepID=UPI0016863565|nr:cytochrome P450 [Leptolyngbya sp. FACHB-261]MBD2102770.1 cytochrome P450 [Leptolyngbya sp. FACHB-261]